MSSDGGAGSARDQEVPGAATADPAGRGEGPEGRDEGPLR
jgi:hypothetical protein